MTPSVKSPIAESRPLGRTAEEDAVVSQRRNAASVLLDEQDTLAIKGFGKRARLSATPW